MARQVQEVTVESYFTNWHGKNPAAQQFTAWYDANLSIVECEKIDKKPKYRIKLSNGDYKVIESHCIIYIETY